MKPIVALLGASVDQGANDATLTMGWATRACIAAGVPLLKMPKGNEGAANFASPAGRKYRAALLPGCTYAITDFPSNDLAGGATATAAKASMLSIWQYLARLGIAPYACTMLPRVTSTDSYATVENQTPVITAATAADINGYIRSLPAPLAGFIDLADVTSSGRDTGKWPAGVGTGSAISTTQDGVHPSRTMCATMSGSTQVQTVLAYMLANPTG